MKPYFEKKEVILAFGFHIIFLFCKTGCNTSGIAGVGAFDYRRHFCQWMDRCTKCNRNLRIDTLHGGSCGNFNGGSL